MCDFWIIRRFDSMNRMVWLVLLIFSLMACDNNDPAASDENTTNNSSSNEEVIAEEVVSSDATYTVIEDLDVLPRTLTMQPAPLLLLFLSSSMSIIRIRRMAIVLFTCSFMVGDLRAAQRPNPGGRDG